MIAHDFTGINPGISHPRCGARALVSAILVLLLVAACNSDTTANGRPEPCTPAWYELVEAEIPTGDGMGHGPDQGSEEWRSVVEFKLGIRGDAAIPARSSIDWCGYIDSRI
jgi:hypothetical protein